MNHNMTIIVAGQNGPEHRTVETVDVLAINKRKRTEQLGRRIIVLADGTVKVGK